MLCIGKHGAWAVCAVYLLLLQSCTGSRPAVGKTPPHPFSGYIESVRQSFAPDKRVVVFQVEANGQLLKGETTSALAKEELLRRLRQAGLQYDDSITVLPTEELKDKPYGLVTISVANIRVQPEHRAELATQSTMGTPVKVFRKQKGWYLVQTPDQYIGWVDGDAIQRMDSSGIAAWQQQQRIIFLDAYGSAYETPEEQIPVSDLVFGDILVHNGVEGKFIKAVLPDGRIAFVEQSKCMNYEAWRQSRKPDATGFIASAKKMMGIPYLWGGTSFKGVDCSGFTKTVYFMNGLVLPRDASQQVQIGFDVDTTNNLRSLQPGDLLFFGSKASEGKPERVVHVAMWLGNGEFIHASGRVQIASINPAAPNYDAGEHKRFLRVKRIPAENALFDLRKVPVY